MPRHGRRLGAVEPIAQEARQVAVRDLRGKCDEVLGADRLVAVAPHPITLELLERARADLLAQREQDERTAVIALEREERVRA